jgi:hypothetical protein
MSVTDLVADITRRMYVAERPAQWGAIQIRLKVLRERLPLPPPDGRCAGLYRVALAKLVGVARDREWAMGVFHDEVMGAVLDLGAVARMGVVYTTTKGR